MTSSLPKSGERFLAIDWLRGLCVLFMIECHSLFILSPGLEDQPLGQNLGLINGVVAPTFLLTAGFALALVTARSMGSEESLRKRIRKSLWRIGQIFLVSLILRMDFWPIVREPIWLVKIDILSCIGLGLLSVLAILRLSGRRPVVAGMVMAVLALAMIFASPFAANYRGNAVITGWLNNSTQSPFPLFPWMGYVLLGGAIGCAAGVGTHGRRNLWIAFAVLLILGLYLHPSETLGHWQPSFARPWVIQNAFDRIWRIALVAMVLLAVEWAVSFRPTLVRWFWPLDFFSRHALMAFLFHQMALFGIAYYNIQFTQMWHKRTSWGQFAWRLPVIIVGTGIACAAWGIIVGAVQRLMKSRLTA